MIHWTRRASENKSSCLCCIYNSFKKFWIKNGLFSKRCVQFQAEFSLFKWSVSFNQLMQILFQLLKRPFLSFAKKENQWEKERKTTPLFCKERKWERERRLLFFAKCQTDVQTEKVMSFIVILLLHSLSLTLSLSLSFSLSLSHSLTSLSHLLPLSYSFTWTIPLFFFVFLKIRTK